MWSVYQSVVWIGLETKKKHFHFHFPRRQNVNVNGMASVKTKLHRIRNSQTKKWSQNGNWCIFLQIFLFLIFFLFMFQRNHQRPRHFPPLLHHPQPPPPFLIVEKIFSIPFKLHVLLILFKDISHMKHAQLPWRKKSMIFSNQSVKHLVILFSSLKWGALCDVGSKHWIKQNLIIFLLIFLLLHYMASTTEHIKLLLMFTPPTINSSQQPFFIFYFFF